LLPARQVAGRDLGDHGVVAGQEVVWIAGELQIEACTGRASQHRDAM